MKISDEQIATALLTTKSNAEAARALELSESQLYARMRSRELQNLLQNVQTSVLQQVTLRMTANLLKTADALVNIVNDGEQPTASRVAAAGLIFKYTPVLSSFSFTLADHAEDELWKLL